MNSIESIGENIRILRLKNGFSQEQLALNAGVNTSYIGQIERGEKNPTIKTLEKISKALEIALIDLLFLVDSRGGGSKNVLQ
jgi:transcriptional regulator with XRE-family HTH domain